MIWIAIAAGVGWILLFALVVLILGALLPQPDVQDHEEIRFE